ncbi:MAG: dihydropteroate synthase [Psychrosphaera sp.]|jgi:dihydropteroate synthase
MNKINLQNISRPLVMGILNVTPDSFSDGGRFANFDMALQQTELMLQQGADIIDIGGESTRPGAPEVPVEQELDRVIPVIEAIKSRFGCAVSLDTSKAQVMQAGITAGVDLINDVCGLEGEGVLKVIADSDVPVCIMHMQGSPRTMQTNPQYSNLVNDIMTYFSERIDHCDTLGIDKSRIIIDPGFGFGKTLKHNYQLLAELEKFKQLECPVLVGLSRKSMIGNLLELDIDKRLAGSIAAATLALNNGADIVRVHDVEETKHAVRIFNAMKYGVENE